MLVNGSIVGRPFTIVGTSSFCNHSDFTMLNTTLDRVSKGGSSCYVMNCHMNGALDRDNSITHNMYRAGTSNCLAAMIRHATVRHVSNGMSFGSRGNIVRAVTSGAPISVGV